MTTTDAETTWNTPKFTSPKIQECIGVWLDYHGDKPENAALKKALSGIFESFTLFTRLSECILYINEPRPGKIFLIVSHEIGKNLIPLMVSDNVTPIEYFFIFSTGSENQEYWKSRVSNKIRSGFTSIEALTHDIKDAISAFDEQTRMTLLNTPSSDSNDNASAEMISADQPIDHSRFYAVPPTVVLNENIQKTFMKDLSENHVWFIQFQLLVEIIIRLEDSEQARKDMISICQEYYENNACEQRKIKQFEDEAENHLKAIYWYTAESFLVHMLNRVCSTEDVDHMYCFRLIIKNLHKRILELEKDEFTVTLKEDTATLYRGKRMPASTLENFRKNVGRLVVMKGFLSTTVEEDVAKVFSGAGIPQTGSVCALFKLNIVNWKECKSSAAIKPNEGAMTEEDEVLFTIGTIWKISKVNELRGKNIWSIELTSCPESCIRPDELAKYLKEQLGETSDLLALGDFLMKIGQHKKAEKYYTILLKDQNLFEQHTVRAGIYNRIGIIRLEQKEPRLATDYFEKAVDAAPSESDIKDTANANVQITQTELKHLPTVFLGKRLASSSVTSKPLVVNELSKPILENNLGHAAYIQSKYEVAKSHFQTALSIMKVSKLNYIHEISRVYSNLGAVEYKNEDHIKAKNYFEEAIHTLQEFTLDHPWIAEYKENLKSAQQHCSKKQRVE